MRMGVVVEARLAAGADNGTIGLQGHLCGLTGVIVMTLGFGQVSAAHWSHYLIDFDNLPCNYQANLWCCCVWLVKLVGYKKEGTKMVLLIKRNVERERREFNKKIVKLLSVDHGE